MLNPNAIKKFQIVTATHSSNETLREGRNKLLKMSDWTQLPDSPLSAEKKAEWAAYRQALRDLPETTDINSVVWPQEPN